MDDLNLGETSLLNRLIRFCLKNELIVVLLVLAVVIWGLLVVPFDWSIWGLPRDPVPVDAIPSFGGMTIEILTMLVVPVLYSRLKEAKIRRR